MADAFHRDPGLACFYTFSEHPASMDQGSGLQRRRLVSIGAQYPAGRIVADDGRFFRILLWSAANTCMGLLPASPPLLHLVITGLFVISENTSG